MNIKDISLPEVYKSSADFRFFCTWFENALSKIKYDTENLLDLYDCLRCPEELLWMLGDTIGYKYDDRLPAAFNRLVILYFMSMIRNKGSKDGVTLAAEVNLAQFSINEYGKKSNILYNRLEDTSIPVNSAYVTPHTSDGYIDIVYFSSNKPVDACIEYVRPLGMYVFQSAGVRYDARTKVSVDSRLTNTNDLGVSVGPTHVGHYRRDDYARMQRNDDDTRQGVWYRNSSAEDASKGDGTYGSGTTDDINPGYRSLYSLQLSNNEHVVAALIPEAAQIFSIGYGPQDVDTYYAADYLKNPNKPKNYSYDDYSNRSDVVNKPWNLRYDKAAEESLSPDVYTIDSGDIMNPKPAVNPVMVQLGDAISVSDTNDSYIESVPRSKNYFDMSKLKPFDDETKARISEVGDNYIIVTTPSTHTGNGYSEPTHITLRELCPGITAGRTYTLSAESESATRCIYLYENRSTWLFNQKIVLTDTMLDSKVVFYGLAVNKGQSTGDCRISNIQVELGDKATEFEPYAKPEFEITSH